MGQVVAAGERVTIGTKHGYVSIIVEDGVTQVHVSPRANSDPSLMNALSSTVSTGSISVSIKPVTLPKGTHGVT